MRLVHHFAVSAGRGALLVAALALGVSGCINRGDTNIGAMEKDEASEAEPEDGPADEPDTSAEPAAEPDSRPTADDAEPDDSAKPASEPDAEEPESGAEPEPAEPEPAEPSAEPEPAEPSAEPEPAESSAQGDCDEAGDDFRDAFDVGELSELFACDGFADADNDGDFFRFELTENGQFTYTLDSSGVVSASLYRNATQINLATPLKTLSANNAKQTQTVILQRGVYYVVVKAVNKLFDLDLSVEYYDPAEPMEDPGNDFDEAMDLGAVSAELLEVGGFVGTTDDADVFRFEVPDNGTLTYSLANVVGTVSGAIYDDDTLINLASPHVQHPNVTGDFTAPPLELAAGTYFFRVVPATDALFTLKLSFE